MSVPYLLHHLLDRHTAGLEKTALIDGSRKLGYGEFAGAMKRCARALLGAGLKRGDRVVICLPKSIEKCWAIFGTSRASGVFIPVNTLLRGPQVRHIVADSGARVVITQRELRDDLAAALEGIDVDIMIAPDMLGDGHETGGRDEGEPCIGEDLAAILYTSGSTGLPKGVMLSHRNLLAGTRIVRTYLGITGEDRILSILPFSFDYGLTQLLTAVEQQAVTVLFSFKLGDEIVRALRDYDITGLAGVPTIWAILTKAAPALAQTPLPALRYITNSGGRVPEETVRRLRALLPQTQIFLMYGLTEAFRSTFLPPDQVDLRPTSIGKAIPECEIFAVTREGKRAKPGEPGILVHRGPTVSLGYWKRPEDTARVLRPHPFRPATEGGEPVCYSGDLVVQDEEGYFSFVGRDDAMIKSAGYRISPTEVEEAVMATGLFRQVAVIGLPDPFAGQVVHAVAVAASGQVDVPGVLATVAQKLPAFMVPRDIELVPALPVTGNGKVDYRTLARERSEHAAR